MSNLDGYRSKPSLSLELESLTVFCITTNLKILYYRTETYNQINLYFKIRAGVIVDPIFIYIYER